MKRLNENSYGIYLDDYNLYRKDRTGSRGGGVCIYVKKSIKTVESDIWTTSNSFESIWIMIESGDERLLIGCAYRPPNSSSDKDEFRHCFAKIHSAIKTKSIHGVVLFGDFNHPAIRWDDHGFANIMSDTESEHLLVSSFVESIYDNFLHQNVHEYTFQTSDCNLSSTLDLIISESDHRITDITLGPPLGNLCKGHLCIYFKVLITSSPRSQKVDILAYHKCNYEQLGLEMSQIDWESSLNSSNIDVNYKYFLDIYNSLIGKNHSQR